MMAGSGTALFALAGCHRPAGNRNVLVFGQSIEPTGLNSAISTAGPITFTASKIFDPLVAYDDNRRPRPKLAASWEVNPDGLTYAFHLRPGVKWHDGRPLTAQDVAFSLTEAWQKFHARGRTTFANVERVESPDPLTSVWHLSRPAPYLLSCLAVTEATVIPEHIYGTGDLPSHPRNLAPVGSGPFRFKAWERGNRIELERNPDYWEKGSPKIAGIVVRFLPDAAAAVVALETGTIDLLGEVPFAQRERLRKNPKVRMIALEHSLSPLWAQLEFNLDKAPFGDERVRQAFAWAIDREFIARNIYGDAEVADSPIPEELAEFHATDLPRYAPDLARAKALLDAAGLHPDARGVRLRATLDFANASGSNRAAAAIRSNLALLGVEIVARPQDQGEYINRIYTRHDFDLCMTGSGAGLDPAIGVQRYYWSKNIRTGVAFSNGPHYRNPEVDRLLETAQVELDAGKRRALYARFQQIVMRELPYLPLVWYRSIVGASSRVGWQVPELGGLNSDFAEIVLERP
jgi:peptide/nickel transport system substrate-binding protein